MDRFLKNILFIYSKVSFLESKKNLDRLKTKIHTFFLHICQYRIKKSNVNFYFWLSQAADMEGVRKAIREGSKGVFLSYFHFFSFLGTWSCFAVTSWLWILLLWVVFAFLLLHMFYNASFKKIERQVTIFFLGCS